MGLHDLDWVIRALIHLEKRQMKMAAASGKDQCKGCVGVHKIQDLLAGFFQCKVPLVQGVQVMKSTGKHCIGWKNKRRGPCIPKTNFLIPKHSTHTQ
ncbi:hypothetical protein PO909_017145 [Leuciscus waleckii]